MLLGESLPGKIMLDAGSRVEHGGFISRCLGKTLSRKSVFSVKNE